MPVSDLGHQRPVAERGCNCADGLVDCDERRRDRVGAEHDSGSCRDGNPERGVPCAGLDSLNPWLAGAFSGGKPKLLFGRMYEDSSIEAAAFAPGSRVFAIAGAGCTARILAAAGYRVTAVDINPVQLEYARERVAGGPAREGAAEKLLAFGRRVLSLAGSGGERLEAFLRLNDTREQVAYWDRHLESRRFRFSVDTMLSPLLLRMAYSSPFVRSLPGNFGEVVRRRMRRCWATHPNRSNPFARGLLVAEWPADAAAASPGIRFIHADAAEYLESCAPGSFDAFTLSNICDGAPRGYRKRLNSAVCRAASAGAMVVTRSFGEPTDDSNHDLAVRDRCFLWGVVDVRRVEKLENHDARS